MRKHLRDRMLAASGLVLLCAGAAPLCLAQAPAAAPPAATARVDDGDESYRIGPGDVLDIVVFKQPDYSQADVRVDNDGMIRIRRDDTALGVSCKTVRQVADEIKERYKTFLRNPYVTVSVKEFNSQPVAVIGAVNTPGRFQLQRRVRLLEMLTLVNGPSEKAGDTVQVIHAERATSCDAPVAGGAGGREADLVATYDLEATLTAAESSNPFLRPGDIVRLPQAEQAYVTGYVKRPTEVMLRGPVTLTEAIAAAGGLEPDGDGSKVRILRRVPGTAARQEIPIELEAIAKRKARDVELLADDIVDVPGPSGSKKFWRGLTRILIPAAVSYPVQVIR